MENMSINHWILTIFKAMAIFSRTNLLITELGNELGGGFRVAVGQA